MIGSRVVKVTVLQPKIDLLFLQKNNEVQQFYFKQTPENKFYQYYYYN